MKLPRTSRRPLVHPLAGSRPSSVFKILRRHGGVSIRNLPRLGIILTSCLLRWPSCVREDILVRNRSNQSGPALDPIFIVGHWRSGTTLLHNLMGSDTQFAYPKLLDTVSPYDFFPTEVSKVLKPLFLSFFPATRPMDDMPLDPEAPQEEEAAMAAMAAPSFFNGFYFPRHFRSLIETDVLLAHSDPDWISNWVEKYTYYLRKLHIRYPQKTLLLKNPANSARIDVLSKVFPRSRFVHIKRRPEDVLSSTMKLHRRMREVVSLQGLHEADLEDDVNHAYQRVMTKLEEDWQFVPERQRVEVRYEDLIEDPLGELAGLYEHLGLGNFEAQRQAVSEYLRAHPIMVPDTRTVKARMASGRNRTHPETNVN